MAVRRIPVIVLLIAGAAFAQEHALSHLLRGFREMEEMGAKHLENLGTEHLADLLEAATEVRDLNGSREPLEDPADPADASASNESDTKEKEDSPPKEDSEEENDDDETGLGFFPIRGLGGLFGMRRPWWTGPNVCVEREEKEDKDGSGTGDFLIFGTAHISNCYNTPYKYSCKSIIKKNGSTKTTVVTYQCCHGYRRSPENTNCTKVETKPFGELSSELGAERFGGLVRSAGLENVLDGNVTIFLPLDAALEAHHSEMDSLNSLDPVLTNDIVVSGQVAPRNTKSFVLGHVVDGVHQLSDLQDEQLLTTLDNTTLRVNFLPGRAGITLNCAKVNLTDKYTENGVVHVVESVLEPGKENLAQLLSEERFSKFKQLLEENDLWDIMSGNKPLTVFAIEDSALEKTADGHKMCMKRILAHHVLPHSLCSAMGASGERLATLDITGGWLPFTVSDGQLFIGNSTKVVQTDIVASNGVLHVAEALVLPSGTGSVSELLEDSGHSEWAGLLEKSGLLDEIQSRPNLTMFVPTDEAVKKAGLADLEIPELQDVIRYHVGTGQSGKTVETMLDGLNLTVTAERSMLAGLLTGERSLTVECARVLRLGGRVCNGRLHEIDSVLRPPNTTLAEFIADHQRLNTLHKLLQGTKLEGELKSGLGFEATFLAPTDAAFEKLPADVLDKLLADKELADNLLRAHVLKEPVCCGNAVPTAWPFSASVPTLAADQPAEVSRRGDSALLGGLAPTACDLRQRDAIVHLVDRVRLGRLEEPQRTLILRRPNSEIILAGL